MEQEELRQATCFLALELWLSRGFYLCSGAGLEEFLLVKDEMCFPFPLLHKLFYQQLSHILLNLLGALSSLTLSSEDYLVCKEILLGIFVF